MFVRISDTTIVNLENVVCAYSPKKDRCVFYDINGNCNEVEEKYIEKALSALWYCNVLSYTNDNLGNKFVRELIDKENE